MPELAIIADDLTGALDAAAPFAMRGIHTVVATRAAVLPEAIDTGATVVGVSTNSREIAPERAREAVRAAVAALPAGTRLFKKVDSRLKGNIAAELDAIPHVSSLVIPAIPAFGRWIRGGKLGGFGVPEPINIADRLGSHAAAATVPDIATQADIEAALDIPHDLPIGARGLAEAIAGSMAPDARSPKPLPPHARAYCVVGSTDPITLRQLAVLHAGHPGIDYVAAPNGVGPAVLPHGGALTVIQATPGEVPADATSVALALAETLARLAPPAGSLLVLSGGATAQVILQRLGIHLLVLIGEALPGLPLARGGDLTFVTKSGGFGDEDSLLRLLAPYHAHEERIA
jgi:uncharacterized protein YgbK (DUF1537 family)